MGQIRKSVLSNSLGSMNRVKTLENFRLATAAQIKIIDRAAEKFSLNAEVLMESAGAVSAGEVLKYLEKFGGFNGVSTGVAVFCGPGHNGGDALVLARHLWSAGVKVFVFASKDKGSFLVQKQIQRLLKAGVEILPIENPRAVHKAVKKNICLIVDALFGSGLARDIKEPYLKIIEKINALQIPVLSLDIPSGLDRDTGQIRGLAVQADMTVSFGLAGPGCYLAKGPEHAGEVKVFSIGFPPDLLKQKARSHFLVKKQQAAGLLPERRPDDHKARQGRLLVLAGREGFWGAGRLAAVSAYRMGAGYVTWAGGETNTHPPLEDAPDILTKTTADKDLFLNQTAVIAGPGFGAGEEMKKILIQLKRKKIPSVLDADAITVLAEQKLFPLPSNFVLTPHSAELGRLFKLSGKEIDQNRCFYAMKASRKAGCLVLLKGFYSVLADQDKCWILPFGNSALAKAGTGDVLTGFIGALIARGVPCFSAVTAGVFVHGTLSQEWVRSGKDKDTLMAQDLEKLLPSLLKKLRTP